MQFGILGPLVVWSAMGETVPVGGPRQRTMLTMLLLRPGRVVTVSQLIDGQYGDDPPAHAANAVQAQVSRLRRSLSADVIEFHGGGYRLTADPEDVDAHRFERLADEGRRFLSTGLHVRAAATLREATELWRGPALLDLPHGLADAARLEDLRLTAAEDLVEAELALPEGTSIAELGRLVAAHPLRERLRGQLMRALHAAGRHAEALEEFDRARRLLRAELGADPSPELAAVHLAILRAGQAAPLSRQEPAAQLTTFVGREGDLERLAVLSDARLVTVLGPGGAGKTRLAIEFAERDGGDVCFVDLSAIGGADEVLPVVPGALGLRGSGFQTGAAAALARRLAAALGDAGLLLVMDNCEHVVDPVAALVRTLLAECRALRILATSREPLGITGETLMPLAPLDSPPRETPAADAQAFPAVRLFADRAVAVRPGFAVGPDNVEAVIGICTALDGLPLAIELAAARLRQFTVAEIATRLAEHGRFRLLSRGDRTAAARHRTLHAVVEWSWDLLRPDEQVLARRFAVFTGGACMRAIEVVSGVDDIDEVLADLVDKSFVESDGERYRMLDTIGEFCAERLAASGEQELLRRAHAGYHLDLAQRADPHLRRAEQLGWLAMLSAEHGNLTAALRWAVGSDRQLAFRMVAALAAYWWLSGGRSAAGEAAAELLRGGIPDGLAEEYVSCVVHAVPRAEPEHWARAGEIIRTHGRELRYPFGAAMWGMAAGPPAEVTPETDLLLGADPWSVALGRLSVVLLGLLGGQAVDGERDMRDALTTFRALGERWGCAQALDWLGLLASWRGEWDRARHLWAEALELLEQLGAPEERAGVLLHRAACRIRQGDVEAASADYRHCAELWVRAGHLEPPAGVRIGFAEIAQLHGDALAAADLLGRAIDAARAGGFGGAGDTARVLTALGRLAETSGEPADALRWHREALAAARTSPLTSDLADAVEGHAGAVLLTGAPERAALLLGLAVALRGTAVTGDLHVARIADGASGILGPQVFAQAYARGAAMSAEQALTAAERVAG